MYGSFLNEHNVVRGRRGNALRLPLLALLLFALIPRPAIGAEEPGLILQLWSQKRTPPKARGKRAHLPS